MSNVNPDLAAILDNEGPTDSVIEAQPDTEADLTPDAPPDEIAEPETPTLEPETHDPVPWEDHVKLRHENEAYRKRWQGIEQAFDGVHDDDKAALLDLVTTYKNDPVQAAAIMRQYADALAANDGEPVMDDATADAPLTRADLDRALAAERQAMQREQQKAAEAQAIQKIESDAVSLGYNPESEDYVALLSIASKNGGDLQKAHAVMTAKRDKIIAEYLASKKAESAATPHTPDGVTPSGERSIADDPDPMRAADRATRELFSR